MFAVRDPMTERIIHSYSHFRAESRFQIRLCNDTIYLHGSGDRLLEVLCSAWLTETVHQDNLLDAVSRQITKVCSAVF